MLSTGYKISRFVIFANMEKIHYEKVILLQRPDIFTRDKKSISIACPTRKYNNKVIMLKNNILKHQFALVVVSNS